jgi:hypothetical protein
MSRTVQLASIAAAALLTLTTVSTMNALASDAYRSASNDRLQTTPMAFSQQVVVVARRVRA